ncbi:MAG: TetR/AcrR family transcriptional regulator [Pseudomonadota bacterium]
MEQKRPKSDLTPDAILEAALFLTERDGIEFSMRDLGASLGAWPNTIYAFYPSKEALQAALIDHILDTFYTHVAVQRLLDDEIEWQVRITDLALAAFETLSQYHGVGRKLTHFGMFGEQAGLRFFSRLLKFYTSIGFETRRAGVIMQVTGFFVYEMSDLEAAVQRGEANHRIAEQSLKEVSKQDAESLEEIINTPVRARVETGIKLFIAGIETELEKAQSR